MQIVDWETLDKRGELSGLSPKTNDKERKQIFKTLLEREIIERWTGKLNRSQKEFDKMESPRIEIRKSLGDANVLMTVGVMRKKRYNPSAYTGKPTMLVSMNGTAELSQDDFVEMNLAAAEARGMYDALMEKEKGA